MKSHYVCKDGTHLPFESTRHVLRSEDTTLIAAISRIVRARLAIEEKVSYLGAVPTRSPACPTAICSRTA